MLSGYRDPGRVCTAKLDRHLPPGGRGLNVFSFCRTIEWITFAGRGGAPAPVPVAVGA